MKLLVEDMFECPFKYDEYYKLSEYTSGTDTRCTLNNKYCYQAACPLKKEKTIIVKWAVK